MKGAYCIRDVGNFLKFVIEAMGTRLNGDISEEQQQKLQSNNHLYLQTFWRQNGRIPHSQVRAGLDLATSQYYEHAQRTSLVSLAGITGKRLWHKASQICARV